MVRLHNYFLAAVLAGVSGLPSVTCAPADASAPPSVPVAIGGKEASISKEFIKLMKPEYDGNFNNMVNTLHCSDS